MQNFQDTFETRTWSFGSTSSICMTLPLTCYMKNFKFRNQNHLFVICQAFF